MRHKVSGRKLGLKSAHRQAMFSNMVASLIRHGRIRTTIFRAKELRRIAERLITLAKNDSLHTRRRAFAFIRDGKIVGKLFDQLAPAFKARSGGYTRIMQADVRPGDQTQMAYIEYLREDLDALQPLDSKGSGKTDSGADVEAGAAKKTKSAKKPAKKSVVKTVKKPAAVKAAGKIRKTKNF